MIKVEPTGKILGATVTGMDLGKPMRDADFREILAALGRHSVLRFPDQDMDAAKLRDFSQWFGPIQGSVTGRYHHREVPEVGILSNVVENGEPIGIADAGQDWHTDMSYRDTIGFVNTLYAVKVPKRDGKAIGDTLFVNTCAAYDGLDPALKERLKDCTATHDFNKFWDNMRHNHGSDRPALTPEQRAKRPPAVHPVFLRHPISGRTALYCNPGYAIRINELDPAESDRVLEHLFEHQLQSQYQYRHSWNERDLLIWEHIGTLHNAIPDYGPNEHRLMLRCQVMSNKVFDPAFQGTYLRAA
jgi:taurine dioxygenase